jgi:hypothetical protein
MPETVLFRLQVEEIESKDTSTLEPKESRDKAIGAGLVAGNPGSKIGKGGSIFGANAEEVGDFLRGDPSSRQGTPGGRRLARKLAVRNAASYGPSRTDLQQYVNNIPSAQESAKALNGAARFAAPYAATASAVYTAYSNYKKTGLELSGATHAAAMQQRKTDLANTAVQLGVAVAINPLLAVPVIAMKAYELSQTNRTKIFAMEKSQITSNILQRNLVKNVAERRF